jgi:MFS family permease
VLPSLHAGFSFGGLAGAAAGGAVASLASPAVHLLVVGALGVLATTTVAPVLLAADGRPTRDGDEPALRGTTRGLVVLLGVIAGSTAFGEGAVTDWGALHLKEIGATPVLAAAGYAGFSLAMACGRLAGNALVHALGPTRVVTGGALLATAGALLVAAAPAVESVLAGFVLIGLGLANVFPIAIARAGAHAGAGGVALASTVGYTGLLGGPPLLGIVAESVGLHVAFAAVAALAAVAAALAVPALGGGERVLAGISAALRRHTAQLGALHAQLSGPTTDRRPYPGLEALAT